MSDLMRQILESKRLMRQHQAALPFSQKIQMLERIRDRRRLIAANPLRRPAATGE